MELELKITKNFKELVVLEPGLTRKQKMFLVALCGNMGNVSRACMECGCSRDVHYKNLDNKIYVSYVDMIKEGLKDFGEECLLRAMDKLDASMIKLFLQSKAKDRGYQPDTAITINNHPKEIVIVYGDQPEPIYEINESQEIKLIENE